MLSSSFKSRWHSRWHLRLVDKLSTSLKCQRECQRDLNETSHSSLSHSSTGKLPLVYIILFIYLLVIYQIVENFAQRITLFSRSLSKFEKIVSGEKVFTISCRRSMVFAILLYTLAARIIPRQIWVFSFIPKQNWINKNESRKKNICKHFYLKTWL